MLLLPYSVNIQALSASTANFINGSRPYLTFDGGVTKDTTTESLLNIKLSNGTSITPATNTSTEENPIIMPNAGESFTDISMRVPATTDTIALSELIGAPNNYWGDDDGDGQGINGIKVTGNLNVKITDNLNRTVDRDAVLNICNAPYRLVLTGTDGSLTTEYGYPNSSIFTNSSVTYYISPKASPVICYAKPELNNGTGANAGPVDIWNPAKGFRVQSTSVSSYNLNFPTTGANNLFFDLDIMESGPLTWPSVTLGGITATMTPNASGSSVRVKLTGTTGANKPDLPQTFELIGYDSGGKAILKYGFTLRQWFITRLTRAGYYDTKGWCESLGYRIPQGKDLTNALCGANANCLGAVGAVPSSSSNHYQRRIGAGFLTEWGKVDNYPDAEFYGDWVSAGYWSSDQWGEYKLTVNTNGSAAHTRTAYLIHGICTYP